MKLLFSSRLVYLALALVAIAILAYVLIPKTAKTSSFTINQVASAIQKGAIDRISIDGDHLKISFKDESLGTAVKETGSTLTKQLLRYRVTPDQLSANRIELEVVPHRARSGCKPPVRKRNADPGRV